MSHCERTTPIYIPSAFRVSLLFLTQLIKKHWIKYLSLVTCQRILINSFLSRRRLVSDWSENILKRATTFFKSKHFFLLLFPDYTRSLSRKSTSFGQPHCFAIKVSTKSADLIYLKPYADLGKQTLNLGGPADLSAPLIKCTPASWGPCALNVALSFAKLCQESEADCLSKLWIFGK